jgi:uncharacterized lipoprotein YmbA
MAMHRPGLLALLVAVSCAAAAAGPGLLRTYSGIEVLDIENKRNAEGKKLPDEWVPRLREQLRYASGSLHLFHRIEEEPDPTVKGPESGRVVQLKVRITNFSGAQAQPKISAVVVFLDKATGEQILERSVDAQLYFDQSATTGALIKLTNKVRDLVKDNW